MRLSWQHGLSRVLALSAPLFAALMIAGCSSSGRFAGPSWNLTGGKGATPIPERPLAQSPQTAHPSASEPNTPAYRGGRDPVTGRALGTPPAVLQPQSQGASHPAQPLAPSAQRLVQAPSRGAASPSHHRTIEVRPGQSLAAIAGEHRVSISALMQANGLRDPYITPGQQLIIPR
jgi:hypothetical protein